MWQEIQWKMGDGGHREWRRLRDSGVRDGDGADFPKDYRMSYAMSETLLP